LRRADDADAIRDLVCPQSVEENVA
jgi:hypothetical protein